MRVIIFGATGMVGQSVLRECLVDEEIQEVLLIGRNRTGNDHQKVREFELDDITDLSSIEQELSRIDACFFCVGISSFRIREAEYSRITYDLTLSVAQSLVIINPLMTFIFVTGSGTDSTGKGRVMWARVKGKTENALLGLGFRGAYMFRPAFILQKQGIKSKTKLYQLLYDGLKPVTPLLMRSSWAVTSDQLGKAMIRVAKQGYPTPIIESVDIKRMS